MRRCKQILFLLCTLALNIHCAQQVPASHENYVADTEPVKSAEKIIQKLIRNKTLPGVAVVVTKRDTIIWKAGYGYADVKKRKVINPNTSIFRIASISKPISAVGLAKMYEDGIINLDASLYEYVPDFPKKKYDFTIRQLASHTAGIRSYRGNEFLNRKFMTIKEGLSIFEKDTLLYEPGRGYLYNSNDWNLVAVAMENASGLDFEQYMKDSIFKPLELKNIFADRDEPLPNKVVFYTESDRKRTRFRTAADVNNYYKLASGGFLATAPTIAKFGNKILYNHFLKPKTKKTMLTAQVINAIPTYYGLGWEVSLDRKGRPFYGHVGNGVGGYGYFYVYPKEEMVIVILTNVTKPEILPEVREVIDNLIMGYRN